MKHTKPHITWGINQKAGVHDARELDEWIDALSHESEKAGVSIRIQLQRDDHTALLFTVGLDISHLEFYSDRASPIIVGSRGQWDDEDIITFIHGDEPSEMEKKYFVPMEDARKAILEYFTTGERPRNISWGNG